MFSFRTTPLLEQPDTSLRGGRVGLLCNQSAWHPENGEYLFQTLYKRGVLKRVFMPEHGLFGELQDQVKLDQTDSYNFLGLDQECEFISLYGSNEESLTAQIDKLTDLDALVVEMQDVGSRYYTFNTTLYNLFKTLRDNSIDLPIYLIDRINPAGRQVEGTMLRGEYASFIGIEGILHRHGLTMGEMAHLFHNDLNAKFPLHIISYEAEKVNKELLPWSINPSPNIPGLFTSHFYSGQTLWEGTNVSEGRGTTRPFELFGAPFLKDYVSQHIKNQMNGHKQESPLSDPGVFIRWTLFIPTFHKYKEQICYGFQLHPKPGEPYHALAHNLCIINDIAKNCSDFEFLSGKYEAGNNRSAIELLVGDPLLLSWLKDQVSWNDVKEHMKIEEQKWIRKAKKVLLYSAPLFRVK